MSVPLRAPGPSCTVWLLPLLLLACDGGDPDQDPDLAGYIAKEDWIDVALATDCRWQECKGRVDYETCIQQGLQFQDEFIEAADCYSGTRAWLCTESMNAILRDPNQDCNAMVEPGPCRFSEGDFATCAAGP